MKKRLIGVFGIISLLLVGGLVHHTTKSIYAANTDNSKEKWSAIGTIGGSSWNKDFPLVYDATDDRYELEIALTAGNEFKIRLNNAWTTSIGYGGHTGAGITTYLSKSGENFKVKTTGNYVLWVKDDNVRNYGDRSYGFGIDKAAEAKYYTVKQFKKDGTLASTESILENSVYSPTFYEEEGYRLEGWYTDSTLTTKFVSGTSITKDLSLYPKYIEDKDYKVYFSDNGTLGASVYAYMWSDSHKEHHNAEWPGEKLEKDSSGKYVIDIDVSKSFNKVIFTNNTSQTFDIELNAANEDTYVLGDKATSGEYSGNYYATLEKTGITNVLTRHYKNGTYTRNTTININETEVKKDLEAVYDDITGKYENLFHGSSILERTTLFQDGELWMTRGKNSTTYSYYGTSGENMTTGEATEWGKAPTSVGIVTNTHKDWDNPEEDGMEGFYITLKDIMEKSSKVEWTYNNGVYSTTGLTTEFLAFTAPCFLNLDNDKINNYFTLTGVEVEEKEDGLHLRLMVSSTNSGTLTVEGVLSEAIITK